MNRTEYVISLIEKDVGDHAPAVAYWMDVQALMDAGLVRCGEISWQELTCQECGKMISRPMIPVMGNGEWGGFYCKSCGFTE